MRSAADGAGLSAPLTLRRAGFSLVELVVSIGLLAVMMTLAGQVFSLSIASTSQANAVIKVSQSLRLLEQSLRADLHGINPERSMLVINAQPINAYWTAEGKDVDDDGDPSTGYDHPLDPEREDPNTGDMISPRADVLMFFTSRKTTSSNYPSVWSNLAQVVYGHAEQGEFDAAGTLVVDPVVDVFPDYDPLAIPGPVFDIRAESWHLTRRNIVLVDAHEDTLDPSFSGPSNDVPDSPDEQMPAQFPLSDGAIDLIAQDEPSGGQFFFDRDVLQTPPNDTILRRWSRRSRIDLSPPAVMADRLGHYFLPKCASFKVEWATSHPMVTGEILWVDPSDVQGSVLAQLQRFSVFAGDSVYDEFDPGMGGRFDPEVTAVKSMHTFFAADFSGGNPSEADPFFPKALRITIDLYDDTGRLQRPTRHVMVIPIGES